MFGHISNRDCHGYLSRILPAILRRVLNTRNEPQNRVDRRRERTSDRAVQPVRQRTTNESPGTVA